MLNDDEYEEPTEEDVIDLCEITGPDVRSMVVQKGPPVLACWRRPIISLHILLDSALTDLDAELEEFAPNAFSSPG